MTQDKYFELAHKLWLKSEEDNTTPGWIEFGENMAQLYDWYINWNDVLSEVQKVASGELSLTIHGADHYVVHDDKNKARMGEYNQEIWELASKELGL